MSGYEHTYCIGACDLVVGDIIDSHDGHKHLVIGTDHFEDNETVRLLIAVVGDNRTYDNYFDYDDDVRILAQ